MFILKVKIQGQSQEMLAAACMQFLGKSERQIQKIALETLEGKMYGMAIKNYLKNFF